MEDSSFYQEIMEEGKQEEARRLVLELLRVRFGDEAAKEFAQALSRIGNLKQLRELHRLAAQSRRVSQFRRTFSEG
ncbi:MAG TPA: hypothetical protein VEL76_03930 [Gemmataceae bacterium]|nr:hypothetical protein [Gemmataceae bacterium]